MKEEKRELERVGKQIRRFAERNELIATSRTGDDGSGNRVRRWWFIDMLADQLESSPEGFTDDEAINWLYTDDPNCTDRIDPESDAVKALQEAVATTMASEAPKEDVNVNESDRKSKAETNGAFEEWLFSPPTKDESSGECAEMIKNNEGKVMIANSITFSNLGIFIDEESLLGRYTGLFQLAQVVCGYETEYEGDEIWLPENKVLEMLGIPPGDIGVITRVLSGNKIINGSNHVDFNMFCFLLLLSQGATAWKLKEYVAIGGPGSLKFDISVSAEAERHEQCH